MSFRSQAAFRSWLRKNHREADELVVRLFKTHAADQGLVYAEALNEALCFRPPAAYPAAGAKAETGWLSDASPGPLPRFPATEPEKPL